MFFLDIPLPFSYIRLILKQVLIIIMQLPGFFSLFKEAVSQSWKRCIVEDENLEFTEQETERSSKKVKELDSWRELLKMSMRPPI
jgi:hypothetical protein